MRYFTLIFLIFIIYSGKSQVCISGLVMDSITGEKLIGANITDIVAKKGCITDNNGYFTLVTNSPMTLKFSYIGYTSDSIQYSTLNDTLLKIGLIPGNELSAIEISGIKELQPNTIKLSASEILSLPSISGKPDLIKALQLFPGIKSQNEGTSLLLVRGGNPGENLYLIDNVKLLYVNHLGGFMSVFNPDIINNLNFYKCGFPARFGGKLSSIVDITQKEGDHTNKRGFYSIGVTDLSIQFEGPLSHDISFIISGRKTLFDLLTIAGSYFIKENNYIMGYGFHDINGKICWKPNLKNNISLNIYQGDDYLNFWSKKDEQDPKTYSYLKTIWGNWLISTNWEYLISNKVFSEQIISYSRYRLGEKQAFSFELDGNRYNEKKKFLSTLQDFTIQSNWRIQALKNWIIHFGLNYSLEIFLPSYEYSSLDINKVKSDHTLANELSFYTENSLKIGEKVTVDIGYRLTRFATSTIIPIKIEPRITLTTNFKKNHQLSANFMNVNQFSHLLYTSGNIYSNEIWIPSVGKIKPSASDQYSIEWKSYFNNYKYQLEAGIFYKSMVNLAMYKEGFINLRGDNWQSKISTDGKGTSSGIEVLVRKCAGNLTGFISYGWSKTTRQFPEINNGKIFIFDYDRTHSASIFVKYRINKKIDLNATWIFETGIPYTPVVGKQTSISLETNGNEEPVYYETLIYGERNSERMRDYHRLDLSINLNKFNSHNELKSVLTLNIYNAYNRKNPVYYYFNNSSSPEIINPEESESNYKPTKMYQLSLFPIIPMISYKYFLDLNKSRSNVHKHKFENWLYHE